MHGNVLGVVLSVLLIGLGYVVHELIRKKNKSLARKVLHILVGNWYFIYAYCFESVWPAFAGLIAFALVNLFLEIRVFRTHRFGTVMYPISIALIIVHQSITGFPMAAVGCAVLALGYGDGLATVVGEKFKSAFMPLLKTKTVLGSVTMFVVSSVVVLLVGRVPVLCAMAIGFAATVVEAYIPWGFDNVSVPLVVYFLVSSVC